MCRVGRLVLEIATWLALINCIGFQLLWVGMSIVQWDKYRASIRALYPYLSPELGLAVGSLLYALYGLVFLVSGIIMLRALGSVAARDYVRL